MSGLPDRQGKTARVNPVRTASRGIRVAVLVLGLGALVSSQAIELRAQTLRVRPEVSLYLPTKISVRHGLLRVQQKVGVALGGIATLTFNERFDIATAVTYLPGYAMLHAAGRRFDVAASAHRLAASTRARYWLRTPSQSLSWEVHSGLGLSFGGTPAYREIFDRSTLSTVVGTLLRYQLGGLVNLELQVQGRLYGMRFGSRASGDLGSPIQVSFGVGFVPWE